jgi:homocysteine S-methyltransferase
MGTELYRRGQFINKPFEGVNLSDPELVERVHRDYVDAGADVIETNTFASNRMKLARVGLDDRFEAINRAGVAIARRAAGDRFVVGAVGPTGVNWGTLTTEQQDEAVQTLVEQVSILLDAGVDGIILETFAWLDELLAAAAKERDPARRKAQYREFQKLVVDDCPIAFLIEPNYAVGYRRIASPKASVWGVMSPQHELSPTRT